MPSDTTWRPGPGQKVWDNPNWRYPEGGGTDRSGVGGSIYAIPGIEGSGGGLLGRATRGIGSILGGGGMGGSNVDTPDIDEQLSLFLPMLEKLQAAGIINTPVEAKAALQKWQQQQAHQQQVAVDRRKRLTGKYAPQLAARIEKDLIARGMVPGSARRMAMEEARKVASGVPTAMGTDIGSYYGQSALDAARANIEKSLQTANTEKIGNIMPANYARTAFADTADDKMIEDMLNKSMGEAQASLKAQMKRGVLSEEGYNAALSKLQSDMAGQRTRLQDIGGGILGGYRTELTNYGKTLSDELAADPYRTYKRNTHLGESLKARIGENMARFKGAFQNAVGTDPLFNVNTYTQAGGAKQGAINPAGMSSATGFRDALAARRKIESGGRGLGSSGVF